MRQQRTDIDDAQHEVRRTEALLHLETEQLQSANAKLEKLLAEAVGPRRMSVQEHIVMAYMVIIVMALWSASDERAGTRSVLLLSLLVAPAAATAAAAGAAVRVGVGGVGGGVVVSVLFAVLVFFVS